MAQSRTPARRPNAETEWVTVGRIHGLYGVHGGVRLYSYLDRPGDLLRFDYLWLLLGEGRDCRKISEREAKGARLVARIEGVDGREAARELLGTPLQLPREALGEEEPGEYLWVDLLGLAVETLDGAPLGEVDSLIETGANDVLVVAGSDRERLIPFTEEAVPEVDPARGLIRVDWDPDF
ncbi:ribosome maturation factor RimM [Thiohalorhabdus methylotrophus]|uniref:Ribosome maturation factor RimM n=1 Tax=Thiohalorhabdus methylotrophus TaxID=3242694 RepID=A0ABV4TY73_9GAMM